MFDEGSVISDDDWKRSIPCFCQGFSIRYIHYTSSAYSSIQYYISMCSAIINNDIFHNLADISRDEYNWELTTAPDNLLHRHGDCLMANNSGFNLLSCKDEIDHVCFIVFNHRCGIRTTTKAETPFRQWAVVLLRDYRPDVLNVQHFRYLCIINTNVFQNPY